MFSWKLSLFKLFFLLYKHAGEGEKKQRTRRGDAINFNTFPVLIKTNTNFLIESFRPKILWFGSTFFWGGKRHAESFIKFQPFTTKQARRKILSRLHTNDKLLSFN